MAHRIGIRREDKNVWERRVPLTPAHVKELTQQGFEVVVQPSPIRAFKEAEYQKAGAATSEDLSNCPVVFAVKEIPKELFQPNHAYIFFAHVIKGQAHNMPMLRRLLELGCTLIDYEKIVDDKGKRMVFFGRHAGQAGMIDTLWALGQRLLHEGIENPFSQMEQAHRYKNFQAAMKAVKKVGKLIEKHGLPEKIAPMSVGFVGYGNVSQGAQDVFDALPHEQLQPGDLARAVEHQPAQSKKLIKVVFKEEHTVRPKDPAHRFDLQEYFKKPQLYQGSFQEYVPHLSVMVNCVYWTAQYPRLVTREVLKQLYLKQQQPRLRIIGDISCDIEGAVECTLECTEPSSPVFVYLPAEDRIVPGVEGRGPVVLAVDNLPCELPVEASTYFGDTLMPFVPAIGRADFGAPFERLVLPDPILRAIIAHRGSLTPNYAYLADKLHGDQVHSASGKSCRG